MIGVTHHASFLLSTATGLKLCSSHWKCYCTNNNSDHNKIIIILIIYINIYYYILTKWFWCFKQSDWFIISKKLSINLFNPQGVKNVSTKLNKLASANLHFKMSIKSTLDSFLLQMLRSSFVDICIYQIVILFSNLWMWLRYLCCGFKCQLLFCHCSPLFQRKTHH